MTNRVRSLSHFAIATMLLTSFGQVAGFFRDVLFGYAFGTSYKFDAYTAVFGLVLFTGSLLSILPNLEIPMLTQLKLNGRSQAFSTRFTSIGLISVTSIIAFIVFGVVFPDFFLKAIAPGLLERPETKTMLHELLRIALPLCFFITVLHLGRGLLNMASRFYLTAMDSLFFNAGIIFFTAGGIIIFGMKSVILPILGCYVSYLANVTAYIMRVRGDYSLSFRFDAEDLRQTLVPASTLMAASLFAYISPIIIIRYATFSSEGIVSSLGYASRLILFAEGTIVRSMMTVFLPNATLAIAAGNIARLTQQTEKLISICLIVSSSVLVIILIKGEVIVCLLFQRGAFDEYSVQLVFNALLGYLPWIIFFPLSSVALRILYANQDYRIILWVSLACLFIPIVITPFFGTMWNGLGYSLTASFHMSCYAIMLLSVVMTKYVKLNIKRAVKASLTVVVANILIGCIYWMLIETKYHQSTTGFLLLFVIIGLNVIRGITNIVSFSTIINR